MINAFKLSISMALMLLALYAGFAHKPYWSLGIITLVFTLAYIHSKLHLWIAVYRTKKLSATLVNVAKTYISQAIVVTILYFIGYGVSSALFDASGFSRDLQDICAISAIILFSIGFYELLARRA